ncbi:MAG: hypothetical protein ABFS19_09295 [Thermodesulfobacteriota bacterium]
MEELSKSHRARLAIRTFKIIADALTLRGYYKPSGRSGAKLEESLKLFEPEIYGTMADPRIVELKGLEYVIDRMPRGIEKCTRVILTANEDFSHTSFTRVVPLKRRRVSWVVSENEICFVISRGLSEIYDVLTHITFLNIESQKLHNHICSSDGGSIQEWHDLAKAVTQPTGLKGTELDQALWNLSIILGRTYEETRQSYLSLEENHLNGNHNNGLFSIIYAMGERICNEQKSPDDRLTVFFTPALQEMIGHHKYASDWAFYVKKHLHERNLQKRPLHVISANMHSVANLLFGSGSLRESGENVPDNLYEMIFKLRELDVDVRSYGEQHGLCYVRDDSGSNIDVMLIDTTGLDPADIHPAVGLDREYIEKEQPVIVVMDYAFGTQAFAVMDELLSPYQLDEKIITLRFESIAVMGKAGILPGNKGDIMLATAHVMEGTPNNYIVDNDLHVDDFPGVEVYRGPIVTVLGTSLQNRDVLERFHSSSWKAVGIEMEGGHYQRAINAAIIQGHIPDFVKIRYAYYASDNPLRSGQTLASGPMGDNGVKPTYMITRVLLEKILNNPQ